MIVGERKGMRLADLRHRITLRVAVEVVDEHRQRVVTWTNQLAYQPAKYQQVSGGEIIRGKQVEAGVNALFVVNYSEVYTTEKQIVFQGVSYGIVRVDHQDGVKRFMDVYCKAAPIG